MPGPVSILEQLSPASSIFPFNFLWCSLGMSWCQVFAKVVQTAGSKSTHRPWLYCPQGPAFIIRLCSLFGYHVWNPMFKTEMLAPPQPSYYTNQVEICWSELPCTYSRLGFQLAVSLKQHLSVLDPCHTLPGRSVLGKGHWQLPTQLFYCFLCFWNPVLTMHWSAKITFGLQPVHCSETSSQSVSQDFHEDAIHRIPPQSNASLNIKECNISLKTSVAVCHCRNTGTHCQQWDKTDAHCAWQCLCRLCSTEPTSAPLSSHSSRAEGGVLCARASSGILPHST